MTLNLSLRLLSEINAVLEKSYPEEGAGFLLGQDGPNRKVVSFFPLGNSREEAARHNRYLVSPLDYMHGEEAAEASGLVIIGVYHSHPDHPSQPSEFDREWAQPFFSYLITSVHVGKAGDSRSWRLAEDRAQFFEEPLVIRSKTGE